MKRLVLLVVVALGMSATSFAGEKVEGKDWKVDVNVAKLSKYLNLDARQIILLTKCKAQATQKKLNKVKNCVKPYMETSN